MGYSMKDLESAGRKINEEREKKANQKADQLLNKTSQGRGLWCIILWGGWVYISVWFGAFFSALFDNYLLGFLSAIALAHIWYSVKFTKEHPFWSSVLCYSVVSILIANVTY